MAERWIGRRGVLAGLSLLGGGVGGMSMGQAATNWVLYTSQNRTAPVALATLGRLLAEVPARTANGLKIDLMTAGTLPIRASAVAAGVADGKVQLGDDTYFTTMLPAGAMMRMPGLIIGDDELHDALPIQRDFLTAAFAKRKLTLLGYYLTPPQIIFAARKVLGINDLHNMVIRTTTKEQREAVLRLGGLPVTMLAADVADALDTGTLHGVYGTAANVGRPWKDKLTYASAITPIRGDGVILANPAAVASLPQAQRDAITRLGADIAADMTADLAADEVAAMAEMTAAGMRVVDPVVEDVASATRRLTPYWEALAGASGKDGANTLAALRLVLGR